MRRSRSSSRSALARHLAAVALAAPALAQAPLPAPAELDAVIRAERARSERLPERLDEHVPALRAAPARTMPAVPVAPGRAPDPAAIAERHRAIASTATQAGPELLVFVSFSMPHASLLRLAEQASRAGAVLVFRGLAGATLRQMVERLQPLARTGAALQIHPEAFTRLGIEVVPTFVLADTIPGCGEASCERPTRRVSGDVSLDHALERLARGDDVLARAAGARLLALRGGAR